MTTNEKLERKRAEKRAWKAQNPEKVKAEKRHYRERNSEKIREYNRAYNERRKAKVAALERCQSELEALKATRQQPLAAMQKAPSIGEAIGSSMVRTAELVRALSAKGRKP